MRSRHLRWASTVIVMGALSVGTATSQDSSSSNSNANSTSADYSSSAGIPSQDAAIGSAATADQNPDTPIKKVGTPFPLKMDPGGYRIGPVHLVDVSTAGFYSVAAPPGQSTQTLLGTNISGDFVYTRPVTNGLLSLQMNPAVSVSKGSAYVNTLGGIDFTKQLTARWSMTASAQWTFYQNEYLLQTPQYLLAYADGGLVLQNVYAQRNGTTTYESNSFAMNYQLSGRTQLSLSPNVNTSFANIDGTSYLITQLGGGGTLTHSFTPNRTGFVYGNLTHSFSTQAQVSGATGWNTLAMGAGFTQRIGRSWFVTGSAGASLQTGVLSQWVPTGTASVLRTFKNGSVSVAYSRTTATAVLLSSGYYDQADIAYNRNFGRKFSAAVGLGAFRSIQTGNHDHGRRAYATLSYLWRPNLAWSFSYAYSNQDSTQATLYSGRTDYVRAGLVWTLGRPGAH